METHLGNPFWLNHQRFQNPFQESGDVTFPPSGNHGHRGELGLMLIPFPHSSPNFYIGNSLPCVLGGSVWLLYFPKTSSESPNTNAPPKQPLTQTSCFFTTSYSNQPVFRQKNNLVTPSNLYFQTNIMRNPTSTSHTPSRPSSSS